MQIQGKHITLGADPEIFVGRGGQFFSAHDLIPGTKRNPFKVMNGAVQVDGMALEFNIDPSEDYEQFQHNLDSVREQLKAMIGDAEFLDVASVIFSEEFLKGVPYENVQLGCEPDFNGYTNRVNKKPDAMSLMRTAGGHVHIGGFEVTKETQRTHKATMGRLARLMDEEVGVYSILWDKDDVRRSMYGQGGCFRPKVYGMEYRSMSNAWLFNKDIVKTVFDFTVDAVTRFINGDDVKDTTACEIMNNSDRSHAFFKGSAKAERVMEIMGKA